MISPAVAAAKDKIKTAPAEISLAYFALGCWASVNESTIASIAVLVISKVKTRAIKRIMTIQSKREILKYSPAKMTAKAARMWNFKLGSSLMAV